LVAYEPHLYIKQPPSCKDFLIANCQDQVTLNTNEPLLVANP
jgi:hypothetical protein